MTDQELLYVLSNEYKDLTAEAQDVLKEELKTRGLRNGIDEAIKLQTGAVSEEKFQEYLTLIQDSPCPHCLSKESKLNGALVVNGRYEDFIIGCPACLKKGLDSAKAESVGLGLLGFSSVLKAANRVVAYQNQEKQINVNQPSDAFIIFVKKRISEIELYKNRPEKLFALLKNPNAAIY